MARDESKAQAKEAKQAEEPVNTTENVEANADVAAEAVVLEEKVNPMTPAEETERQQAESYPQNAASFAGQHEEGPEKARQGFASTSRARVGRVVVLHEDAEHDGELYKAGAQDIPLEVADAFIGDGKAFEPAGKKRGR